MDVVSDNVADTDLERAVKPDGQKAESADAEIVKHEPIDSNQSHCIKPVQILPPLSTTPMADVDDQNRNDVDVIREPPDKESFKIESECTDEKPSDVDTGARQFTSADDSHYSEDHNPNQTESSLMESSDIDSDNKPISESNTTDPTSADNGSNDPERENTSVNESTDQHSDAGDTEVTNSHNNDVSNEPDSNRLPVIVNSSQSRTSDRWDWIKTLKTVPKVHPCKVCGIKSTGVNYGALTCRRCKIMFQKTVLHGVESSCENTDSSEACVIDKRTKDPCRKCWLDKCLSIGMHPMDVRLRWNNAGRKLPLRCPRSVRDLTQVFRLIFVEYNRKVNIKYIRPVLLSDRALEVGSPSYKHVMFSEFSQHYEPLVSSLINFSLHIPGFESLPIDDQMILLKTGFVDLWVILNARRLHSVRGCITLHDNTQIPSCELITMYSKTYAASLKKVAAMIKKLKLTIAEKALVVAAALVCPDRPNLIEKKQVLELRKTLLKVKKVFSQLARPRPKSSRKKSDKIMPVLTAVNQLGKQHADLMNFYRNQPDKLTVSPVIREVFDLHPPKTYKEK